MKILHIHTNNDWGGGEYQVMHLLNGLRSSGIECMLAALDVGILAVKAVEAKFAVHAIENIEPVPFFFFEKKKLTNAVKSFGPDLIHAHDSEALDIAESIGRKLDVPVVLSRRIASKLRRNLRSRLKYSPNRVKAVLAISNTVKNVMVSCGYPADSIHIVPSGLDLAEYAAVKPAEDLRKLYPGKYLVGGLGKLSSKKNWQMLVKTAAKVRDSGLPVQWIVAGEGNERGSLEQLAKAEKVADIVHFIGFRKDGVSVLKALDLLFFPSVMEGASVTVREAMVLGVPVVAVDAPGTMESLAGYGWGIDDNDIDNAAISVLEVLTNESRRKENIDGARRIAVERYDIRNTVQKTIEAYGKVISHQSPVIS